MRKSGLREILTALTGSFVLLVFLSPGAVQAACSLVCPANIFLGTPENQCTQVVNYPAPSAIGSCGTIFCVPPSGASYSNGTTMITCNETSGASCSFLIGLTDTEAPSLTCPSSISVSAQSENGASVTYSEPSPSDNCDTAGVPYCFPPSGSIFPVGVTQAGCSVTDDNGNVASCSFTVAVSSVAPSKPTCANGAQFKNGVLKIRKLGGTIGDEVLKFTGSFSLPGGGSLDLASTGAELLVEESDVSESSVYELSARTASIPGGTVGSGCAATDGWNGSSYSNVSGAFSSKSCAAGSALGLQSFTLLPQDGGFRFKVKAKGASIDNVPLKHSVTVTAVFGSSAVQGAAGECASVEFSPSKCVLKGTTLICR